MAKKGREAMAKRARERARLEKQEAKLERREAKVADDPIPRPDQDVLMEQFAALSQRFERGDITEATYNDERRRIFEELGIQTD